MEVVAPEHSCMPSIYLSVHEPIGCSGLLCTAIAVSLIASYVVPIFLVVLRLQGQHIFILIMHLDDLHRL